MSVTLVFEENSILPAENIYCEEIRKLQLKNERIMEISRLVIAPNFRNTKEILVLLFNYLYIYLYLFKKYTSLVIEINRRHIAFYQTLLNFKEISIEKPCPNVQNAPAILMHLHLGRRHKEIIRLSTPSNIENRTRSLYPYFLKPEYERIVAYCIEKQAPPLSIEEKQYFGFTESGSCRYLCI